MFFYACSSKGRGKLTGKVVRLNKSVYDLKQASRTWHAHLAMCLEQLGFEQCMSDVCVVPITVVHVDDIFAVGLKNRSDILCEGLNRQTPVTNLSELK